MLSLHLCEAPVVDFDTAKAGDNAHFKALFHHMLDAGIYLPRRRTNRGSCAA